jgi:fibronectin type 3 domain-containing protein
MYIGMTSVTAKNVSGGIQLSWSKVACAKGYFIYRKTSSNAYERIAMTTTLSYIDTNVKPGYSYAYAVRAYNGSYLGSFEAAATIRLTNPSLTLSKANPRAITLTYSKVTGAKGYEIYRKVGNGSYTKIATTTSLSYSDKNVKNGTKYTYVVRAYNGTRYSAYTTKSIIK